MTTHAITLDGWRPSTLNSLLGHWSKRARRKRADRTAVFVAARAANVPRAAGRRRVSLAVSGWARGGPLADPDAFWKSTLDALVACGMLTDDDSEGVELGPVHVARGPDRTVITLEDL